MIPQSDFTQTVKEPVIIYREGAGGDKGAKHFCAFKKGGGEQIFVCNTHNTGINTNCLWGEGLGFTKARADPVIS